MRSDQAPGTAPNRIFISYRRHETDYPAGWLFDRLGEHFPGAMVFKDVDSIEPGDDFTEVIRSAVTSCDVLLAVIGDQWLTATDEAGRRRLDDPEDFVRLEIETALTRGVRVVPILVHGARMPRTQELPVSLAGLVRRQAMELTAPRFDSDMERLVRVLDRTVTEVHPSSTVEEQRSAPRRPTHHTPAVVPPSSHLGSVNNASTRPSPGRRVWAVSAATVLALVALAIGYWTWPRATPGSPGSISTQGKPSAAATFSSGPALTTWQPLPGPRTEPLDAPAAATLNGELWVAGGMGTSVRVYTPASHQWRDGPDLPTALSHAALVSDGRRLFLLGGLSGESGMHAVYSLDSAKGRWVEDQPLPQARFSGAAAWDGSRIVYAGGAADSRRGHRAASRDIWALDSSGWTRIGALRSAREHLAAASDGRGSTWFLGGAGADGLISDVDLVRESTVTPATALPAPVQGSAAVWTPESGACAIGGSASLPNALPHPVATVTCLGAQKVPPLAKPSYQSAAVVLGDHIYVVTGTQMYSLPLRD